VEEKAKDVRQRAQRKAEGPEKKESDFTAETLRLRRGKGRTQGKAKRRRIVGYGGDRAEDHRKS
jgi:hypothetical protein